VAVIVVTGYGPDTAHQYAGKLITYERLKEKKFLEN
jgi:hypothetical protein